MQEEEGYDIEILQLTIENFKSYRKAVIKIGNEGLVLVEGENVDWSAADSNGVGKTTIADAITWGFYGKTLPKKDGTEGFKGDQVVNNLILKDCHVGIKLKIGPDIFDVDRYRLHEKHANKLFFKSGSAKIKGATADDLQEKIEKALGMDYRAFTTAIVVKGFPFTGSSDGEQKKVMDKIIGLEWLQEARAEASANVSAITKKLEKTRTKLSQSKEYLTETQEYLAELQGKEDRFADGQRERKRELKDELEEIKEKLDTYSTADIDAKLAKVRENIETTKKSIASEAEVKHLLEFAREAREKATNDCTQVQADIRHEEGRIAKLAHTHGECTECETKIDPKHIKATIEKHELVKAELARRLLGYQDLEEGLKKKVATYKTELQEIEEAREALDGLKDRERNLLSEIDTVRSKMDNLKASIKTIQGKIDGVGEETSPYAELIAQEKIKRTMRREEIADLTIDEEEFHEDLKDWEFIEISFGNAGVRSYILDDVAHDLNLTVKGYARALTDGQIRVKFETHGDTKKGETREKFGVKVENLIGGDSYHENSGGESCRVDACVMLSLNYLSRTRQNRRLRFMFLDEFLDGLDKTGRDRVIKLLKEIAKDCRIFVVTHSLDLKPKFNEVIKVRKEGGFATIV